MAINTVQWQLTHWQLTLQWQLTLHNAINTAMAINTVQWQLTLHNGN